MKTNSKFPVPKGKKRDKKYNNALHINATFEDGIKVLAGVKKPTKAMLKRSGKF